MPIYEYRCNRCGRGSTFYYQTFSAAMAATPACPHCSSTDLSRLVSRVATLRSEESRLESLADPANFAGLDENDPRSVAQWARKMGEELGEDLGPEFDEMVERMEAGEMPDGESSEPLEGTE